MRKIDYSLVDVPDLRPIIKNLADSLFPCAATRLGISVADLKKGLRVRVRPTSYSTEVNADVNSSNSVITINAALMIFYHKILKVYVATLNVGNSKTKVVEKATITQERVVRVTNDLLQAFLEDRILRKGGFKLEELTEGQEHVLHLLTEGCEKFSIAHELGHVIIGRCKDRVPEYPSAETEVIEFLKHRASMKSYKNQKVIESWTNELCADVIGLKLLLSLPREEDDEEHYKGWLASSSVISGELRWMIEDYEVRLKKEYIPSRTHPPESVRAKYLNSFIAKEIPDEPTYHSNFFYFGMNVLDAIFANAK